jgi:hypothetical protein
MNAVEIEQAISDLALQPFDPAEFAYAFLEAFGNKATTLKKLRSGTSNKSDLGGVLQTKNIHIAVAEAGAVTQVLTALKASPATSRAKARFILATDGESFEAEDLDTGETVACSYQAFPDHFGFFLPLAGITTVKQLRDSSFDIRATSRLNRLYVELLKDNPDWGTEEQRHEMNHFMARLIFCFFAEDTDIFSGSSLFTDTVAQMSARDSANTHDVISEIFRAMNTQLSERAAAGIPRWADAFPYVNGGLFSGSTAVPMFSKIARSYLLHIGGLDWTQINPDIFGSMIQAVADEEERGALGMHYTSVPNILKVLNPLFLDDLRDKLAESGDNARKLLNLRNRMARIRVFDPACGSGNFLVIAYKQMREIEAEINQRRGEPDRPTDIPLTNFRGIELRNFSAEIARLALIIAEYQCNVQHRGKQLALNEFLPLSADNWITCGNALRLDWLAICPPTGTGVKLLADDLFETPLDQAQIDFENEGGETYICSNPPYIGTREQEKTHKADMKALFEGRFVSWKAMDYVCGWFFKAADYGRHTSAAAAFVTTNSICQGQQVPLIWPELFSMGVKIHFAHTSFKWANLASHNAGVTVVIVGITQHKIRSCKLFSIGMDGVSSVAEVNEINPYLIPGPYRSLVPSRVSLCRLAEMVKGNYPVDGGHLLLSSDEREHLLSESPHADRFIRPFIGSNESIKGLQRYCLWINSPDLEEARSIPGINKRIKAVEEMRLNSKKEATNKAAMTPHKFDEIRQTGNESYAIVLPVHSSENRDFLPVSLYPKPTIVYGSAFALYDAPLWNMALIASRLHLVWIATVCGKLETRYRYSNTLGWNTFPVPTLTEKNEADLTRCAEDILLAREAHFPATIADLYNPNTMPDNLRAAHERNDEVLERIYIGRRFKNDTERLEKLFDLYSQMTDKAAKGKKA